MNILFYYARAIIPNDGGIASVSLSLIHQLEDTGHKIFAIARQNVGKGEYLRFQYYLPNSNSIYCEENINYIVNLLNKKKINIVFNQQAIDNEAQRFWTVVRIRSGVQVISTLHNPITLSAKNFFLTNELVLKRKLSSFFFRLIDNSLVRNVLLFGYICKNKNRYRKIIENSDAVVTLCDGMRDELVEMTGMESKKIHVIPNFISSVPPFIHSEEKENLIVWCGQTNFSVKRLDVMLNLWESLYRVLPDWSLCILGDGHDLQAAKNMVQNKKLHNISFCGRVNPSSYYKKAKFVVITSSYESFSLVTLEAMAYSAIPVGFKTFPAAKFMLEENYDSLFVDPYHLDKIQNVILSFVSDKKKMELLSKAVYRKSLKFQAGFVFQRWLTLLNA